MKRIHLPSLDLNLLVVFDRMLDRRSVTGAARDLGLSQPAASRALQRLRETMGDPLFVRVGREMLPTERARELAEPVAQALAAMRVVFQPPGPFDPAVADGAVIIAIGSEAQIALGDAIVQRLWARAPGLDVRFRDLSADTVMQGHRGEIDLAISPDLDALPIAEPIDISAYVRAPLYTRRWKLIVPEHRATERWDLDRYCAANHAIVSFEGGGVGFVDAILQPLNRTRRVAASVTSWGAAVRLVGATELVTTAPDEALYEQAQPVRGVPHPLQLPDLPMVLLWHPRLTNDPRHRFVREQVSAAVRERAQCWP